MTDELKEVILKLQGNEGKIRIILNKADQVSQWELTRVYGAITWYMGKVVTTPDVPKVYVSSFWKEPFKVQSEEARSHLEQDKKNLLDELRQVPKTAALRKGEVMLKRGRLLRAHALVCAHLRRQMPFFGAQRKQDELLATLDEVFREVSKGHNIPLGDFPDTDTYRKKLQGWIGGGKTFANLPGDRPELRARLDACLENDIPPLMKGVDTHAATLQSRL